MKLLMSEGSSVSDLSFIYSASVQSTRYLEHTEVNVVLLECEPGFGTETCRVLRGSAAGGE